MTHTGCMGTGKVVERSRLGGGGKGIIRGLKGWILMAKAHIRSYLHFSKQPCPFLYLDLQQQNNWCGSEKTHGKLGSIPGGFYFCLISPSHSMQNILCSATACCGVAGDTTGLSEWISYDAQVGYSHQDFSLLFRSASKRLEDLIFIRITLYFGAGSIYTIWYG